MDTHWQALKYNLSGNILVSPLLLELWSFWSKAGFIENDERDWASKEVIYRDAAESLMIRLQLSDEDAGQTLAYMVIN